MRMTAALLFAASLALPGCSALKVLEGEPNRDVFELRLPQDLPRQCGAAGRGGELVIELPKASGTLDSERIMIRPSELQTQYLPDAQWGDTVPVMLQTLLVRGFGTNDSFRHVGRAPLGSAGDHALISEITDFNAQQQGKGAVIRLAVSAQIVREMDASVIARRSFVATAVVPSTRTNDLIPAFDAANQQLIRDMTDWGLSAVGVNPARCRI